MNIKVFLLDGRAFLEVSKEELCFMGDEKFVKALSKMELYNLAASILLEIEQNRLAEKTVH